MGLNTNGQNAAAAGLAAVVGFLAVHTAVPNTSGSNEVTGGSYARQAVTWNAPALGLIDNTAQITHPIPAGQTAFCYGLWSAVTVGTFYGYVPRAGVGEALSGFGSVDSAGVTSNTIQSAANGLANSMQLLLYSVLAESLPTGLSSSTIYYVIGAATNTFQVSLTDGGAAVDITGQGELFFVRVVPEPFVSAGSLVAAAGAIDLTFAMTGY
jgi:hypothetical protein